MASNTMEHKPGLIAGSPQSAPPRGVNVGAAERWISLLGGGALIAKGLRRGGPGGLAAAALGAMLAQRGATGHCQLFAALGADTADPAAGAEDRGIAGLLGGPGEVRVESVATVLRPAADLYRVWNDPLNLPRFMKTVTAVQPETERRARWTVNPPVGPSIEFVAEKTHQTEGEHIAWRSADTTVLEHTGEVRFRELPTGRGTAVHLNMKFTPPGGAIGANIAGLFDGAMEMQLRAELKRFKQWIETGEVATIEGQSSGRA